MRTHHSKVHAGKASGEKARPNSQLPEAVNPRPKGINNFVDRAFHAEFKKIFSQIDTVGRSLLEIECAGSPWLPYFNKEFGFHVTGIDASEHGCRLASEVLKASGLSGMIVCADLFHPPTSLRNRFDVVVSFDLVQRFEEPAECLRSMSEFLKPGGMLITRIPNLTGLVGQVTKVLNRNAYAENVPLSMGALAYAHEEAGLTVTDSMHCLFADFNVINLDTRSGFVRSRGTRLSSWANKACWMAESAIPFVRPNAFSSPYILCVAEKR